ncbi:unnamed protein product [Trichobilharzia regenti]|nr:unnamed protein product [Trichobilharzia regenti]
MLAELLDYEDEEQETVQEPRPNGEAPAKKGVKGAYVTIHSSGFRDFILKPELLRAIVDCGFEHPSEVQHECIPQAILSMDVLCQAKSGMGKTAVFVIATLQQLDPEGEANTTVLVLCHTRELAFQISKEYERFSKYMPKIKVGVFFGGIKTLKLQNVKHFIIDECDKMLDTLDMRRDVQEIFRMTPHQKQVMMFSATMSKEIRPVCRNFMQDPLEIFIENDSKLTLHGLRQHYVKVKENEKNRKLFELLDELQFNQVIIFVKSVQRCMALAQLLVDQNFPAIAMHRNMAQEERLERYQAFKNFQKRLLVDSDTYLHRVARAGRFGTKGLAITFISDELDAKVLNEVQNRFEVNISELPDVMEISSYMEDR